MRARDIQKALKHPEKIKSLNLRSIKPPLTEVPEEIFAFKNLEELNLSRNEIKILPKSLFDAFPKLKRLSLNHNLQIDFKGFENLSTHRLTWLDLSYCGLNRLPDFVLKLDHLQHIGLGGNAINRLPFEALPALKSLDISKTLIEEIPPTAKFEKLELLDISSTKIKNLPDEWVTWSALKKITCRNKPALRKRIGAVDRYRKDFNWLSLNNDQRLRFFCFFHPKRTSDESLSASELLIAANSGIPAIRYTALELIEQRFDKSHSESVLDRNAEFVFTGRIIFEARFRSELTDMGVTINKLPGEKTTHVVIGEYPFYQGLSGPDFNPAILTTRNLLRWVNKMKGTEISAEEEVYIKKIRGLINSPIPANVDLGLQILRTGPVPERLITDIFVLWKTTYQPDRKSLLKDLLELHGASGLPKFLALYKPVLPGDEQKVNLKAYKKVGLDITRLRPFFKN